MTPIPPFLKSLVMTTQTVLVYLGLKINNGNHI